MGLSSLDFTFHRLNFSACSCSAPWAVKGSGIRTILPAFAYFDCGPPSAARKPHVATQTPAFWAASIKALAKNTASVWSAAVGDPLVESTFWTAVAFQRPKVSKTNTTASKPVCSKASEIWLRPGSTTLKGAKGSDPGDRFLSPKHSSYRRWRNHSAPLPSSFSTWAERLTYDLSLDHAILAKKWKLSGAWKQNVAGTLQNTKELVCQS